MCRKGTFAPKQPKKNSSEHNSRQEIPKYLFEEDPNFSGNYYEKVEPYTNDMEFKILGKKIYNEKFIERVRQNQTMQEKQVDALIKEVVITVEKHHTKKDILGLFDMLRGNKKSTNTLNKYWNKTKLKPLSQSKIYKLPEDLNVKRKMKNENLEETGYHILELSGHYDEGHFIRIGKWEELTYYPSKHIFFKEDGNWYIKSDELNEDNSEETFDIMTDMSEFKKVYNYHWHVKYTHFNIETGLSARFSKYDISGLGRLKKVAEYLGLRYVPEEKIPFAQSVKSVKDQHHIDRQNKYTQLMLKFQYQRRIDDIKASNSKAINNSIKEKNVLQDTIKIFKKVIDLMPLAYTKKINKMETEIENMGQQIKNFKEQEKRKNLTIKSLKKEVGGLKTQIYTGETIKTSKDIPNRKRLSTKRVSINRSETWEDRAKSVEKKFIELKAKPVKIKEIEKTVKNPINTELQKQVKEKSEQIKILELAIDKHSEYDEKIKILKNEYKVLEEQNTELNTKNNVKDNKIAALKAKEPELIEKTIIKEVIIENPINVNLEKENNRLSQTIKNLKTTIETLQVQDSIRDPLQESNKEQRINIKTNLQDQDDNYEIISSPSP